MGIIDSELSEFELNDKGLVRIEYNKNNTIHIHIGIFRINLTEKEFEELANTLKEGKNNLEELKNGIE